VVLCSFDPVKRLLKTALDQPLAEPLDRSRPTRKCLGDALVGPIRSVGVGIEQNLGTANFLCRSLQFLDNALKLIPFLIRQSHNGSLLHGTPPCAMQNRQSGQIRQPDFLAVTKH
jgi:hypothetical protein